MAKTSTGASRKMIGWKPAPEIQDRIDAISSELSRRSSGIALPTSSVLEQIVIRGLEPFERELGLTSKPSKPTKAA
jgi:hypothetical protein